MLFMFKRRLFYSRFIAYAHSLSAYPFTYSLATDPREWYENSYDRNRRMKAIILELQYLTLQSFNLCNLQIQEVKRILSFSSAVES